MVQIQTGLFNSKFKNQLLVTFCANILTFSHGAVNGWFAPNIPVLQSDETPLHSGKINLDEISWIGSLICIGGVVGNLAFGYLLNKIGRKRSLVILGVPLMCSWTTIYFGTNVYHLYCARLLSGITGGGIYSVLPIFLAEIADDDIRGTLCSSMLLVLNFGMLVGFILGAYLPYSMVPLIIIGFPIVYTVAIYFFHESPQFLLECKKEVEAKVAYKFYKNFKGNTKRELQEFNEGFANLKLSVRGDETDKDNDKVTLKDFGTPAAIKGLVITLTLSALSQSSGSFAIVNYTAKIFSDLGANVDANVGTIIIGAVQVLGSYSATLFVDRFGRKILLFVSSFLTAVGLISMGIFAYFSEIVDLSHLNWIPIVSLSIAIFAACLGIVPLPLVVMTEIIPLKIRSVSAAIVMVIQSLLAFAMLKIYPLLMFTLNVSGVMFLTGGCCVLGAIFIFVYVPETKGKCLSK